MIKRTATGIILVAVMLPLIYFCNSIVFPVAMAILSVIAMYEILNCIGSARLYFISLPAYIFAAAFPLLVIPIDLSPLFCTIALGAGFAYLVYLLFFSVVSKKDVPIDLVCEQFALSIYVTVGFTSLSVLGYSHIFTAYSTNNRYFLILVFLGAWVTDVFCYTGGYFYGKHSLCPAISPKKTVEGTISGTLMCTVGYVIFALVLNLFLDRSVSVLFFAAAGFGVSIVSQIGDLVMSVLKRHHEIKDFGNILPGHGGILDRFDGVILVAPAVAALAFLYTVYTINI